MIVCVYIGFDIIGTLYGLPMTVDKVWTLEWIVGDRITSGKVFAVDWPTKHMSDHICVNVFLAFS